jgi:hypothetical protein
VRPAGPQGTDAIEPQELAAYAQTQAIPAQAPPQAAGTPTVRTLIAARFPVSRMSREEQRLLAQVAAPGRSYHLGGGVWFVVLPAPSQQEAAALANKIGRAVKARYGDTCKVVWAHASSGFALTPASLSGAAPLPAEITRLLEQLL